MPLKRAITTDSFLTWMVVTINNSNWRVDQCGKINY